MPSAPRPGPKARFEGQGSSDAVGSASLAFVLVGSGLAGTASCSLCRGLGVSQHQGPNQAPVARPRESSPTSSMGPWAGPTLPEPSFLASVRHVACLCPPVSWTGLRAHLGSPLGPGFFWGPLRLDPHPSPSCLSQGGAGGLLGSWARGTERSAPPSASPGLVLVPRLLL